MRTVPNYGGQSQTTTGLGISHCEMGPLVEQPRVYPPEAYPSPTPDWPDLLMPPENLLEATLDVGPFSPATQYENLSNYPDVSASPLSFYESQTLSASSEYGPPIDIAGHQDMMGNQSSNFWPSTTCVDGLARPDSQCKVKEEPNEFWDQGFLSDSNNATGAPMAAQMARLVVNDNVCPNTQQASGNNGTLVEVDPNVDRASDRGQRATVRNAPYEVVYKFAKENGETPNDDPYKILSASGLECTVCAAVWKEDRPEEAC
ncbi:hypothetical protein EYZ11_009550 [Aspergillus tanneri]|uniref:Uncharacterized protein n=1 Tax=Aspergillus tanneri TaxID=1220188 RepID=A0A4S3J827_9EURO|nr:hypothetical protein EYZ11_009550 [Aspergillus tanneri]